MAGDVFKLDDNGYNLARGSYVEVPPGLEDSARLGARVCPEDVITLEE